MTTPQISDRVSAFLKTQVAAGRLIFVLDATGSRERTWDMACQLQNEMFLEADKIGGLEVQLVYYRGIDECKASHWTESAQELARQMRAIRCDTGHTKIGRALAHIRKEHEAQKVDAVVFVGDACEETPQLLYDAAAGLGVPLFVFQEGNDSEVEGIFRELVRLTHGAYCKFSSGSARQLAELLRAVAAFAAGGRKALANMNTDGARKLLGQLK